MNSLRLYGGGALLARTSSRLGREALDLFIGGAVVVVVVAAAAAAAAAVEREEDRLVVDEEPGEWEECKAGRGTGMGWVCR